MEAFLADVRELLNSLMSANCVLSVKNTAFFESSEVHNILWQCFSTGDPKVVTKWSASSIDSTLLFSILYCCKIQTFSSGFLLPHWSKKHYEK
jgi:hypothetical protein